jgi:Tol biopolymer transport system component
VWEATAGGTIGASGVFVAGFEVGEYPSAITATLPAGGAGNPEPLTASADVVVRERSSDMIALEISNFAEAGIVLIDLATAGLIPVAESLTTDEGNETAPAWWPDGKRLAYASDVSGMLQVYDVDVETGEIRQLVDDPDGSTMPAISPDGTRLAYIATTGDDWQLYVADLPQPADDGSITPVTRDQATRISTDAAVQYLLPWWSPDGTQLAFSISRSVSDVAIQVAPSDGSAPPQTLGRPGFVAYGWSAEGDGILTVDVLSDGQQNLLVIDPESGEVIGFVPVPVEAFMASWSPDNTELMVIDVVAGAMWLTDADGSGFRQGLDRSFIPRHSAWRPVPLVPPEGSSGAGQEPDTQVSE